MLTVFRFSKKAPLPSIISFVYDADGEQAALLQVRLGVADTGSTGHGAGRATPARYGSGYSQACRKHCG